MPNSRLLAMITAAVMFAPGPGANAAFTLSELQEIERLILGQDCVSLWSHLRSNPSLVQGNDPLALELRNFSNGINGGLIDCLAFQQGQNPGNPDILPAY